MVMFTWTQKYYTTVPMVDEQHKKIVDSINELQEAMKAGKGREKVASTIDFMVNYTVRHFADEEKMMRDHNYPDYPAHKAIHEKLVADVIDMKKKYEEDELSSVELAMFVTNWLKDHILQTDMKYVPHVKK